jgi:C4-dicarboxylate-specific signal transduction histidine kinase
MDPHAHAPLPKPRCRIVVVDDEPVLLDLLAQLFVDDHDVVVCKNGAEALAAMADGVDILLADKNLPDVSGLDLLDEAKRRTPDAECLIITGYASVDTAVLALARGAFAYIVKPPRSIFDVRRTVEQAIDRQAMGRENRRLLQELAARNAELEAALEVVRRTQGELVQAEKLAGLGTLAAGIAHEVASPLFGVMGLAEAIEGEDDVDVMRAHAREIVLYSRAIKDIVVQLSGYARTAERDVPAPVRVADVLHDAVRLVCRSKGLPESAVQIQADPALCVAARPSELQQVVVNLVKNALEAVAEAGGRGDGDRPAASVSVRAERDGEDARVVVRDAGPGIPEDVRKDIFDPFFTTKPPGQGTGLGLNIVYRLVTHYGGTVRVESTVGVGTSFIVRLPLATPKDAPAVTGAG